MTTSVRWKKILSRSGSSLADTRLLSLSPRFSRVGEKTVAIAGSGGRCVQVPSRSPVCSHHSRAKATKSIYIDMDEFPEKYLWRQILLTSEMRMTTSRQTNAIAFTHMEETREVIRRSQEMIRRTDEFIRRVMPISR